MDDIKIDYRKNMGMVTKALEYAGAFEDYMLEFNVLKASWQWHDENSSIELGSGTGRSPDDNFNPRCIQLNFYAGQPTGPYSSFNPKYQEFNFASATGVLTIKGKSKDENRPYTCYLTFDKN